MSGCATCRHWQHEDVLHDARWGTCHAVSDGHERAFVGGAEERVTLFDLTTRDDFGCVLYEERNGCT